MVTPALHQSLFGVAEKFESHVTEYIKGQISSYFTDKLLGIVGDIMHHMKEKKLEKDQNVSSGNPQIAADLHCIMQIS
ncbi:hypothetical protein QN277_018785 [Acacia crassicarpa]|uniref:Uncharacterized protein n=1 Tax=Acacia crassicarpa TaxID=499986 RepID=A0AAE1MRX2_9FABA|nr:hypothetical protein QN277_018785 [Acacia crassicarpa]